MPYVAPSTVVAGQTYSAASHNIIVNDVIDHESRIVTATNQSVQVFTNEAARDAAIPSPSEGQMVYLTSPTVPAATGENTYLPSGIQTIYNGSAWVCVTPVGAFTNNSGNTTSTSYTTTLTGTPGTNPSVTLSTGTTAIVDLGVSTYNSGSLNYCYASVAVSGATTIAANDSYGIIHSFQTVNQSGFGISFVVPSLTAGTNTFTMQYRVSAGTGTFVVRRLTVRGIA